MVTHLVLLLRDDVVVSADLAEELKGVPVKAGHDGIPAEAPTEKYISRACTVHMFSVLLSI